MSTIAQADQATVYPTPEGAERRMLSYGGGMMLVQFTFAAGVTTNRHHHPHEQIGYVVSGAIDLYMEGHPTTRLNAGGSYYVTPDLPHHIVTLEPTVLIDCFTPIREDFLPS